MSIFEDAYYDLYQKFPDFNYKLDYSGRFKGYNANIKKKGNRIEVNLSKNWKTINKEIQIGLIQELLLKILKDKKHTKNIDMYNIFLQKIHIAVPKDRINPLLKESFDRVNEKYFHGLIETPNLIWGNFTTTKLGSYDFGTDTITISTLLKQDQSILDYVMYHEILHKAHKFKYKNGRTMHHTRKFKKKEKQYENADLMEKKIIELIRKNKKRKLFDWF